MTVDEFVERLEKMVGYPIRLRQDLVREFESDLELEEPDEHEETLQLLAYRGVHWAGEFREGPAPWSIREAQPPRVLARHFAGLLVFRPDFTGKPGGFWLADLNPRSDGLHIPIYYELKEGASPRWYIFDAPGRMAEYTRAKDALESAEAHRDAKGQAKAAERLAQDCPRAVALFSKYFERYGVKADGPRDFPDPGAARLFAAYDAFGPIAETLVGRAQGQAVQLAGEDVARCAALVKADPDYPPHVLMAMLAPGLSGDMAAASKAATEAQKAPSATALSRRWAERILEGRAPFDHKS